jgi:DnaJ-class molecular chaperone
VKVKVDNHKLFTRKENDIEYNLNISMTDAIFGNSLEVETLDHEKVFVDVIPGSQSKDKIVVKNKVIFCNLGILFIR